VSVVSTIEAKCKRCYACIRQCPAKAIRVEAGQAKVISERCIACGQCLRFCPQNAKKVRDGMAHTWELLNQPQETIAILAPSFPAAFPEIQPKQVPSGIRELGFDQVLEVAFGADLVGQEYERIANTGVMPVMISSPCPAVVSYIEKYYPELLLVLAPVVSPMIAMGRVIKQHYRPDANVVFIGPCIAKKKEMEDPKISPVIDEVLTYEELRLMFANREIELRNLPESDFDGPRAGVGRIFPVSGGLLKTAAMKDDILENDVVVTEGRDRVLELIEKVFEGKVEAKFLDLLFCEGCINGPKMANDLSVFVRKDKVSNFLKSRQSQKSRQKARADRERYAGIDLRRDFTRESLRMPVPSAEEIQKILESSGKLSREDELNCGACGYPTCREQALAVYQGFAEAEMCLPYTLDKLEKVQDELTRSNADLRNSFETLSKTQQQLVQSEKLASVGQLAAGVAHELNNPLGGILIYTSLLMEKASQNCRDRDDLKRIVAETDRCRKIVRGLLDFSRQTRLEAAIADLNKIIENTLALVTQQALFHNIQVTQKLDVSLPKVFVDVGQMQQVFLNIILNAAEAMDGKGCLTVATTFNQDENAVSAAVADTGPGMSAEVMSKIYDPFFTTKPPGKGTGLGLAIAYGIIQKHGGEINVQSELGKGTAFAVTLPTAERMEKFALGQKHQNPAD
jgi:two-component system NtrC family sensor kinase